MRFIFYNHRLQIDVTKGDVNYWSKWGSASISYNPCKSLYLVHNEYEISFLRKFNSIKSYMFYFYNVLK